jgi:hypothetical protein
VQRVLFAITALAIITTIGPEATPAAAEDSGKVVEVETRSDPNRVPWRGGLGDGIRFQCLWLQNAINYAGYVNKIEFNYFSGTLPASFNNCKILLCHSTKTALEATFANNYTGNTPVEVFSGTETLSGSGWLDTHITPNKFNYNNSHNLLMDVVWNGDNGRDVFCYRANGASRRCYSYTYTATTGIVYTMEAQYIRLTLGTMPGVEPTSLGRVKTLFR